VFNRTTGGLLEHFQNFSGVDNVSDGQPDESTLLDTSCQLNNVTVVWLRLRFLKFLLLSDMLAKV
tara:strand:+ start:424 stop:618 length:195 start_codon:yes stop_codon:yes gene_type:complete